MSWFTFFNKKLIRILLQLHSFGIRHQIYYVVLFYFFLFIVMLVMKFN